MPTYTPLQSIELTSSQHSITFSNILQNYQDLVIRITANASSGVASAIRFNGDTSTSYSATYVDGSGSTPSSYRETNSNRAWAGSYYNTTSPTNTILNIQNYSNSTTFKTFLNRTSYGTGFVNMTVSAWRKTEAINSITISAGVGSLVFLAGSRFDLYGISPVAADTAQAFGGTEVFYDSTYVYHVFKGSGTFTPYRNLTCDVLAIAGGGASTGYVAGGGGAGGLRYDSSQSVTSGTSYTVTIGAGGSGGSGGTNTTASTQNGSDSRFGSLTAAVGGGGGGGATNAGRNGGSGGGAGGRSATGGTATSGQGNNGGTDVSNFDVGCGGGGAGAVGGNAASGTPGNGGAGSSAYSSWGLATGTGQLSGGTYYYAGGGGGGGSSGNSTSSGGLGGGGAGASATPSTQNRGTSGTTNTGGGAGGSSNYGSTSVTSANGGSGIVIVRYAR